MDTHTTKHSRTLYNWTIWSVCVWISEQYTVILLCLWKMQMCVFTAFHLCRISSLDVQKEFDAAGVTSIAFTWRGVHHWWLFRWNDSFGFKPFLCMGEYWQRRHDCHLKVCLWPSRARDLCSYAFPRVSLSLSLTHTHTHKNIQHTHTVLLCSTVALIWNITFISIRI